MEPRRDEVGIRLDDGLQGRVGAYAGREGLTVGEAIAALLYQGLEFAERQRAGPKEDIEDLQRELAGIRKAWPSPFVVFDLLIPYADERMVAASVGCVAAGRATTRARPSYRVA